MLINILILLFVILACILSFAIGFELGIRKMENESVGTLRVDHSDPESPEMLFLELKKPVNYLHNGDLVVMDVKIEDYIRRK